MSPLLLRCLMAVMEGLELVVGLHNFSFSIPVLTLLLFFEPSRPALRLLYRKVPISHSHTQDDVLLANYRVTAVFCDPAVQTIS